MAMQRPPPHRPLWPGLPPVAAPAAPGVGQVYEIGRVPVFGHYRILAVTGRSFTVAHQGRRQRFDLVDWHGWLQARCQEGNVHLGGHPMQAPVAASLGQALATGSGSTQPTEDAMDPTDRDRRLRKVFGEVNATYTIARKGYDKQKRLLFQVSGGEKDYLVSVRQDWTEPATCTCPDFGRRKPEACKHLMAVLMQEPELQCQCLDFFL